MPPDDAQSLELQAELKKLFPAAWAWYVADWADVIGEEPPKYELDEMITFLLRNVRH